MSKILSVLVLFHFYRDIFLFAQRNELINCFLFQFGKGYTLTMSRGPNCDVEATAAFVRAVVPDAGVKSDASGELVLALGDAHVDKFVELFQNLEKDKARLDVLNFGLSVTTMEDVFIK